MEELVRKAWPEDIHFLAATMREEDVNECYASGHFPKDALFLGFHNGITYTLMEPNGPIAGMLGVTKSHPEAKDGLVWMLATPAIEQYPMTFLRRCKPVLDRLYDESGCELLWNHTHKPNTVHHKWLKWLGFSFLREVGDFYEFARLKGG